MWKCFLALALFLSLRAPAQESDDSLGKYSYLIQTNNKESKSQATGFFVRHRQRLFFITAAHCLTGWDPFGFRRIENCPDTVFIRLSNDTSQVKFLPLPVLHIKEAAKPFHAYEYPDVSVVEIKDAKKYPVFSIEKFFEEVQCDLAKVVWVYGYPNPENSNDYLRDRQQPFNTIAALGQAYCVHIFLPDVKLNDPVNYYTYVNDGAAGPGLSGAPAYLMTEDNKIVFGGMYIGGTADPIKTAIVVRPEYVIDKIMARILNE